MNKKIGLVGLLVFVLTAVVVGLVIIFKPLNSHINNCLSDKGFYCDKNNTIVECPLGTLCPNLNMKNPEDCPSGYYCETVIDNPIICPLGYFCPNICK